MTIMEKDMKVLKKFKIKLLYDPVILFLGLYALVIKSLSLRDICIPIFTATFFIIDKTRKQPKYWPTDK
jgi:hypothetical protein